MAEIKIYYPHLKRDFTKCAEGGLRTDGGRKGGEAEVCSDGWLQVKTAKREKGSR